MDNDDNTSTLDDMSALVILIGASARDTASMLGLETQLAIRTVVSMVMLGVVLGLVVFAVWLSITFLIAAGLYEYADLGLTLSIACASILNLACTVALILRLKRMAQRLAFPETRLAVRTLLDDASCAMKKQEQQPCPH